MGHRSRSPYQTV
nr:unnamed protein product [Callosobruchus chinensis]